MKKSIKSFSIGLIIGVTISIFSGMVFARNLNMKNIDVYSGGIKVIVNGDEIGLRDVLNNNVEPFLYSGTTYVPIRAISETLNKVVLWNNENSGVYIFDKYGHEFYSSTSGEYLTDSTRAPLKIESKEKIYNNMKKEDVIEILGVPHFLTAKEDIYNAYFFEDGEILLTAYDNGMAFGYFCTKNGEKNLNAKDESEEKNEIIVNQIEGIEDSNVDIKIKNIDKNNIKSYYEDIKLLNDMKLHYAYSKYYKEGNEYSDLGEVMLCFTISEKNKSVNISFSENRDLLLDYYHLKKENIVSKIRNNSAIIIDNTRGGYGVSFNKDGLNYCVEATGYSIQEVVELIENIFESKIGTIMEIVKAG